MPILDIEDAVEARERIDEFFQERPDRRADVLRRLFAEVLDFDRVTGRLALASSAASVQLPDYAERIAQLDDVQVLYVALETTRVNKREAAAVAQIVERDLRPDTLLIFANASADQLHLIHPQFGSGARPTLRRMVVERDMPRRTAVQQVANIYRNHKKLKNIREALNQAFDVEPVTKDFFKQYKALFERAESLIADCTEFSDPEDCKQFVQTLFNRLMFVYFLSRKGWLTYEGETDYLNALWAAYEARPEHDNFYEDRLTFLFFEGLNNPDSRDLRGGVDFLIGDVPFLNGGLFEEDDLDKRAKAGEIKVPDNAIRPLMNELFDKFNFTVMESTPFDIEVAVDPEMLGKVFEELITERHDSGAYYTPRPVVSFMCREALKGFLEGRQSELTLDAIAAFVDDHDASGLSIDDARAISQALDEVTVVDPACGSGAYLVGMMQELVELQTALYSDQLKHDARSLYQLKLHIIERNLYGVDLDPFAVNIAMLRLWLSLAIEYEDNQPEPLPNLDFKILEGDSLLGPDPSEVNQSAYLISQTDLAQLKADYMRETDPNRKESLIEQIKQQQSQVRETMGDMVHEGVLDWRVEFAEVIANGGFDIAVANPPYIRLQRDRGKLGTLYMDCGFETFARTGDIYQLFYERGCQLLRSERGLLAFITSNSWLRTEYGKHTRRYFADNHAPLRWLDLGKDVFDSAIVDSGVLLLRTGGSASAFPAVDMDAIETEQVPPEKCYWGEIRPNGDQVWAILSGVEWPILEKLESVGTPLRNWNISIRIGLVTSYNAAFIVDDAVRNALIAADPKSDEIIKPVLKGKNVGRWHPRWARQWLIDTHSGYGEVPAVDVDAYPAVKQFLDTHYDRLERRTAKGVTPYHLRECSYHEDFGHEKLFWMVMSPEGRFAYSDTEMFCSGKTFFMTGRSLKYLCAVLNSNLVTWYMRNNAVTTGMGLIEWVSFSVLRIPVPRVDAHTERTFVTLVDEILQSKTGFPDGDVTPFERHIDQLVYDVYGLTEEEIAAVEARVSA